MGLLDYLQEKGKGILAGGAKPRAIVAGLLGGDTSALQGAWNELKQLGDPNYMRKVKGISKDEAFNIALDANPIMAGVTGSNISSILKNLKKENPSTFPKIPTVNVFKNDVGLLDYAQRLNADDAFENGNVLSKLVNIDDIIPTQRNITSGNLERINNVNELPELIYSNGKYYVKDGHHRISRDILTGDNMINANVFYGAK